jgi:ABC-type Fe3+-hydroxamate transport system substrate-binding protein
MLGHLFNEVLGREVPVPEAPQWIASFSPAATETLFLLGLGDKVVAADPDLIVYEPKMFAGFQEEDLQGLMQSRGWEDLRAVRLKNAFVTPRPLDFLAHHGPSFITEALPWLEAKFTMARERIGS